MREIVITVAAPENRIVHEPTAQNTWQNATYSKAIMDASGWRSALIVTDDYHLPLA